MTDERVADDWRDRAECLGMDPDVFFPARGDHEGMAVAVAICEGCEVKDECLADALLTPEGPAGHGIRGGTNSRQRRKMRKPYLACPECGTVVPRTGGGGQRFCPPCSAERRAQARRESSYQGYLKRSSA